MAKLRVHNFSISLDGYGAGPDQSVEEPLGVGGEELHEWIFRTRTGREYAETELSIAELGQSAAPRASTTTSSAAGTRTSGPGSWAATCSARSEGSGVTSDWSGWWGDEPPYHCDVFVLTHHERAPIAMAGGTTFHFVTDGIESALERAFAAAGGQDVRLGGGVATIQQYLHAGLVDELHVAMAPKFLGSGERLFDGLEGALDRYEVTDLVGTGSAVHVVLTKTGA